VEALKDLYAHQMNQDNQFKEQVAASMTYFSFSLEEFAREILTLIEVLDELKLHQSSHSQEWWWLAFWSSKGACLPMRLRRT
jgi:hypothetical protein